MRNLAKRSSRLKSSTAVLPCSGGVYASRRHDGFESLVPIRHSGRRRGRAVATSTVAGQASGKMDYSVADAVAASNAHNDGDTLLLLPHGIAPGAKAVMRREKAAAEHVRIDDDARRLCPPCQSRLSA